MSPANLVVITGGTGSGKSTVAAALRAAGYPVIDADAAAREALSPEFERSLGDLAHVFPTPLGQVRDRWPQVFGADGVLDRKALGRIVFADAAERKVLESFLFPYIESLVTVRAAELSRAGHDLVFLDSPLFFEMGELKSVEEWWVRIKALLLITAPLDVRVARTVARDGVSPEVVRGRIAAQLTDEERAERARPYRIVVTLDGGAPIETLQRQAVSVVPYLA